MSDLRGPEDAPAGTDDGHRQLDDVITRQLQGCFAADTGLRIRRERGKAVDLLEDGQVTPGALLGLEAAEVPWTVVSGIVVRSITIPVGMAYAQVAGVPPQGDLYSAIVVTTAHALFATRRHLKITASSTWCSRALAIARSGCVASAPQVIRHINNHLLKP